MINSWGNEKKTVLINAVQCSAGLFDMSHLFLYFQKEYIHTHTHTGLFNINAYRRVTLRSDVGALKLQFPTCRFWITSIQPGVKNCLLMEVSPIAARTLIRTHMFARVIRIKESFIKSMLHSRPLRTSHTLNIVMFSNLCCLKYQTSHGHNISTCYATRPKDKWDDIYRYTWKRNEES